MFLVCFVLFCPCPVPMNTKCLTASTDVGNTARFKSKIKNPCPIRICMYTPEGAVATKSERVIDVMSESKVTEVTPLHGNA